MFFPVVEEQDIYNSKGVQLDDINSVLEFVIKKFSNHSDSQATDEDDDQPDFFQLAKTANYILSKPFEVVLASLPIEAKQYTPFYEPAFTSVTQEISTPPPDSRIPSHC